MKPRVIAPYKVLAVAIATASCGKATSREQPQAHAQEAQEAPASPALPSSAAPIASSAEPEAPGPPVPTDDKADPKLLLLRAELDRESSESAIAKLTHYRPLCDKDGYPLVGNVNRKGPGAQPSQLCRDVRARKPRAT